MTVLSSSTNYWQSIGEAGSLTSRIPKATFSTSTGVSLIPVEPKDYEITTPQINWIGNYIREFESVLFSDTFTDPADGYAQYIDVNSFIDHHILVELTKNIDGIRLSTYMTKDRGSAYGMVYP